MLKVKCRNCDGSVAWVCLKVESEEGFKASIKDFVNKRFGIQSEFDDKIVWSKDEDGYEYAWLDIMNVEYITLPSVDDVYEYITGYGFECFYSSDVSQGVDIMISWDPFTAELKPGLVGSQDIYGVYFIGGDFESCDDFMGWFLNSDFVWDAASDIHSQIMERMQDIDNEV